MLDEPDCESDTHLRKRGSQSANLYRRRMHRLTSNFQPVTKFTVSSRSGPDLLPGLFAIDRDLDLDDGLVLYASIDLEGGVFRVAVRQVCSIDQLSARRRQGDSHLRRTSSPVAPSPCDCDSVRIGR
jgi:hypothetical protein